MQSNSHCKKNLNLIHTGVCRAAIVSLYFCTNTVFTHYPNYIHALVRHTDLLTHRPIAQLFAVSAQRANFMQQSAHERHAAMMQSADKRHAAIGAPRTINQCSLSLDVVRKLLSMCVGVFFCAASIMLYFALHAPFCIILIHEVARSHLRPVLLAAQQVVA